MASIDNLSIQITASTKSAADKVDALVKSLNELVKAINSIDTSKIQSLASSVDQLGSAMSSLKGTNAKSITKYVEALNNVSNVGKKAFEPIVESETKVATKTEELAASAEKVNTNLKGIEKTSLEDVANSAEKASSSLGNALSRVTAVKSGFRHIVVPTKSFKNLENQINRVVEKYNALRERMQKSLSSGDLKPDDDKYMKMSAQLDALRNKYDELILKQKELAMEGSAIRLNPAVEATLGGLRSGFSAVAQTLKFGLVAGIKGANLALKPFRMLVDKATGTLKRFGNGITRVTKMLKLMVTRMALRKVIEEVGNGFKSLALHSEEFNQSVSSMMNGSKKLGYSFAAMVSPIINALAPAIVYLINLFVKLANVINQVFSALTGSKTWNKAKDFSENWADNIKAANKSAKELKKTILGFDEINQMQEKYTPGGDTSDNIVDMFETQDVEKKWQDFVDDLKKMWDAADFSKLGHDLGQSLKDALDSIPWDKIKDGARRVGASLATLLNGFEEVEGLGYSIGKTFAEGLNTVFEAIDSFVTNKHWASTGHFIADTLNGWFENIDWELIKHTFEEGFRGLGIAIAQFVMDFRWDNLSDAFANLVNTLTGALKAFFTTKLYDDRGFQLNYSPAYKIAYELAYQIVRSIQEIDWKQFGQALGAFLQALIDAIKGAIDGLKAKDWEPVKTALEDAFTGMSETLDFGDAAKAIIAVLIAAIGLKVGKWGLGKLGAKIVSLIFGGSAAAKAAEAAKGIGDVAAKTSEVAEAAGEVAKGTGEVAKNAPSFSTTIGNLATTISGLLYSPSIQHLGNKAIDVIDDITKGTWLDPEEWDGPLKVISDSIGIMINDTLQLVLTPFHHIADLGEGKSFGSSLAENFINPAEYARATDLLTANNITIKGSIDEVIARARALEQAQKTTSGSIQVTAGAAKEFSAELGKGKGSAENLKTALDNIKVSTDNVMKNTPVLTEKQKALTDAFNNTAKVEPKFTESQKKIADAMKGVTDETNVVGDTTKVTWESFVTDTANAQISFAGTAGQISADMDGMTKDLTDKTNEISKAFSEDNWTFSGVIDGLANTFLRAIKGVKKIWNDFVNDADKEGEIGGGKFKIKLPHFAMGGFPEEDGLFWANHGEMVGRFSNGKTAVANNAQIVEGIRAGVYDAVSMAMARPGGNDGGYIANTIILDGEVVARAITKAQNKQNMRYSPQMA